MNVLVWTDLSCSIASSSIWVVEMHNGADSRLTADFIKFGMLPALDVVERDWRDAWRASKQSNDKEAGRGALIIVGNRGQNKFFSNGGQVGLDMRC